MEDWRRAEAERLEQIKAGFARSRASRGAAFAAAVDEGRASMTPIVAAPYQMDGWDLLMRGDDDLLGAKLSRLAGSGRFVDTPALAPPKGYVVHFDDEGLRIMVFGRRWGKLGVLSEDTIPFSEVDPVSVEPGSTFARHKIARLIFTILAEEKGLYESYERRLSGFANSLIAPNIPVRRLHQSG